MNICLVSYEYPPETFDGIGTYTRNLAHALVKLGEDVDVITFTKGKPFQYLDEGVHVHRINPVVLRGLWRLDALFPSKILAYSIAVSRKLNELLKNKPIRIIEGPEVKGELFYYLLTRRSKVVPVVTKLHTPSYLVQKYNFSRLHLNERTLNFIEKQTVVMADHVSAPSQHIKDTVAGDYRIASQRIEVVPHPVDEESFRAVERSNSNGSVRILFAGRIEKIKGVETLARAIPAVVKEVLDCAFTFLGNDTNSGENRGSLRRELREYLQRHNCLNKVAFHDRVEKEELIAYYQQSDITVVPSFYESLGFVCLEAMACGKAVIASKAGGLQEIIRDGQNGFLIHAGDSEGLAQKIIALCENADLRNRLGREARRFIETHYSSSSAARQTLVYYRQIIESCKR